ncbi:MAG: NADH/Ubiquinone/plastoquinone [Solirubrobacterales bacterium]|nr:NADH/Ubiquinone/plastoquinone [Solirubrobacterales bacterium]
MTLAPLVVVVPLLGAAVLMGAGFLVPRRLADTVSIAVAAAVTTLATILLVDAWPGRLVVWLSGWHPRKGDLAIGIALTVDPLGAGLAVLVAALVTAALVFSWRYFDAVTPIFHALMLLFLAGMTGFCLTGDLFNLFVLFELMGVAAYALTGYKIEEKGPLQGALNFAITNSVGAFMVLLGIGLVYGRTGALNLAQIGRVLAGHHPDGLVIVAFALIACGFLVKAAAVPFHFWLADAHAVAPVPVCVLLSGVMVPLGLYAVARVYWTAFSGAIAPEHALQVLLVVVGAIGAVAGSVMCFLERHLKRLLAFSTVSHTGLFLVGIGILDVDGASGTALFVVAHGCLKAALFLLVGIVAHRLGTIDELDLRGRGRHLPLLGIALAVGGLALASLPPFGPWRAKAMVEEAASHAGYWWIPALFALCSALTGGAVLRATARIFLGWGPAAAPDPGEQEEEAGSDEPETSGRHDRTPATMWAPAGVLLLAGLAAGLVAPLRDGIHLAAARLVDRAHYAAAVLDGAHGTGPIPAAAGGPHLASYLYAVASVVGAGLAAALALERIRLRPPAAVRRGAEAVVAALRGLHSGQVGDYVTWLTAGAAAFGGLLALAVR